MFPDSSSFEAGRRQAPDIRPPRPAERSAR